MSHEFLAALADQIRSQEVREVEVADWLDEVTGSVSDEAAFREVLDIGRAFRLADR